MNSFRVSILTIAKILNVPMLIIAKILNVLKTVKTASFDDDLQVCWTAKSDCSPLPSFSVASVIASMTQLICERVLLMGKLSEACVACQ